MNFLDNFLSRRVVQNKKFWLQNVYFKNIAMQYVSYFIKDCSDCTMHSGKMTFTIFTIGESSLYLPNAVFFYYDSCSSVATVATVKLWRQMSYFFNVPALHQAHIVTVWVHLVNLNLITFLGIPPKLLYQYFLYLNKKIN
jgi:hypothetical protein